MLRRWLAVLVCSTAVMAAGCSSSDGDPGDDVARGGRDDAAHARIDPVAGKRNPSDFAIWRKSPSGEQRQMEWDSPWGKGAPGWHLECSVMSQARLGHPFDIHTGGIDHREIHHPNEIAQNQAFHACCGGDVGAAEAGFTPALLLSSWDLRPFTEDSEFLIALLQPS